MEKKIFLCFAIVVIIGISAWAFVLGGIGASGKPVAEENKGDELEDVAALAECNWGLHPRRLVQNFIKVSYILESGE